MRITPKVIKKLYPNQVFVFGSNPEGNHAGGAAGVAYELFGAKMGKGAGLYGNSYALPTMEQIGTPATIDTIRRSVDVFRLKSKKFTHLTFFVTPIACGIAGKSPKDVAPLFEWALDCKNIYLPKSFLKVLYKNKPITDIRSKINLIILLFKH